MGRTAGQDDPTGAPPPCVPASTPRRRAKLYREPLTDDGVLPSMLKFLVPAVAVLGLTAFAAQSHAPTVESEDVMGWHLSREGEMAKLAYGAENSDILALMLTCEPGRPTAVVYGAVQPDAATLAQASLGPSEVDPLSGGDAMESRVPLNDPVMRDFARRGRLQVKGDAGGFTLTSSREDRRAIGDFFAYCATAKV